MHRCCALVIGIILLHSFHSAGRGQEVNKEQQDEAIAKIKELEGKFEIDDKGKGMPVVKVILTNTRAKNADLELLKGLPFLRELHLGGTIITNSGLAHAKTLTDLRTLDLRGTGISDGGLEYLRNMTRLQVLNLEGTEVGDKGLKNFSKMEVLSTLNLRRTKVTDAGVEELKKVLPEVNVIR